MVGHRNKLKGFKKEKYLKEDIVTIKVEEKEKAKPKKKKGLKKLFSSD